METLERIELLVKLFLVVVIPTERINRTKLCPSVAELLRCVTHEAADVTAGEVYPEDLKKNKKSTFNKKERNILDGVLVRFITWKLKRLATEC